MSANVLFLTEAGNGIGFGHLSRSVALADGFKLLGCDITFIVRGTKESVIKDREFAELNEEWFNERYLKSVISDYSIIITDSYQASDKTLNFISRKSKIPVFLIDSKLKYGNKGIILFPSVYADEFIIDSSNHRKILSGINYLLFTKEMWKGLRFLVNKDVRTIGISLGSSSLSVSGLSAERLKHLFPTLNRICVFGNLNTELLEDQGKIEVKLMGRLSKEVYIEKLINLDLLISNGGQTLNEALLIGLPVLPVIMADNQLKNVKGWEKKNLVKGLDSRNSLEAEELFESLTTLKDYNTRKEFNQKCRLTIDPHGAVRSAKEILNLRMN